MNLKNLLPIFFIFLFACNGGTNTSKTADSTQTSRPLGAGAEIRRDIFTGKFLWVAATEDFNQKFNAPPGSIVLIPAAFDWIGIAGKMDGITFVTEGQSVGSHINFEGAEITNSKIIANQTPGVPYGLKLTDAKAFGLSLEYSGDFELAGVNVDGSYMGIHVGTDPKKTYKLDHENIKIHDCIFQNTYLEAMYIGQDQLGGPFINGDIRNNVIRNAGNDGIQCRNGSFIIEDNDIDGTGAVSGGQSLDHAHGILNGGNTKDAVIRRNKLRNVKGFGVFTNGYGNITISDNNIECGISGIFTKNFEFPDEDLQKVGFQKLNIFNNTVKAANGKRIEAYYKSNGCPVSVNEYDNTGTGADSYMAGITVTHDKGPTPPTPPKPTPAGVFIVIHVYSDKTISTAKAINKKKVLIANVQVNEDGTVQKQ
jgi:hypothetical protein